MIDFVRDRKAFESAQVLSNAGVATSFAIHQSRFEITTLSTNQLPTSFPVERVLGVAPLYQFLVPFPGGRWQLTQAAFDPAKGDWFDVFGDARAPGEWGHWTGRGMNWNSVCAGCHNTRVRKNYDPKSDSYATAMAERGIGCEACHGPMKAHVQWQRNKSGGARDPNIQRFSRDEMLSICGSCHARRGELTGDFKPGDSFFDHYTLSIPDAGELFYADGQVKEEDFEFTAFLGSKMHAAGVRCHDCHDPHSGKTVARDNLLCLRCHAGAPVAGLRTAPKIDPVAHSHHQENSAGAKCVECHMPKTTFMQRHARRDHGFTLPDPLLTTSHGIPNACTRCHADKTPDWALSAFEKWFSREKERPSRARAQTIARARAGQPDTIPQLIKIAAQDPIPLWRASGIALLDPWINRPEVRTAIFRATTDPDPLVRSTAAHALQNAAQAGEARAVPESLLKDPLRAVRVEAAWALRSSIDTNSAAGGEMLKWLEQNRDQPGGLLNLSVYLKAQDDTDAALQSLQQAVLWDGHSAPIREILATFLAERGRTDESVIHLRHACALEPTNSNYRYLLGLALNEIGQLDEAVATLEKSVELDRSLAPAWYNLGLAYSVRGEVERATQALAVAQTLDSASARIPYALATILVRSGQTSAARAAAQRALELDPNYPGAAELLRTLRSEKAEIERTQR